MRPCIDCPDRTYTETPPLAWTAIAFWETWRCWWDEEEDRAHGLLRQNSWSFMELTEERQIDLPIRLDWRSICNSENKLRRAPTKIWRNCIQFDFAGFAGVPRRSGGRRANAGFFAHFIAFGGKYGFQSADRHRAIRESTGRSWSFGRRWVWWSHIDSSKSAISFFSSGQRCEGPLVSCSLCFAGPIDLYALEHEERRDWYSLVCRQSQECAPQQGKARWACPGRIDKPLCLPVVTTAKAQPWMLVAFALTTSLPSEREGRTGLANFPEVEHDW